VLTRKKTLVLGRVKYLSRFKILNLICNFLPSTEWSLDGESKRTKDKRNKKAFYSRVK
jgi:hypothetical protein